MVKVGKIIDNRHTLPHLPGVDDGAKNADETRKMLRMAFKDGIDEIIATLILTVIWMHPFWRKGWGVSAYLQICQGNESKVQDISGK